MTLQTFLPAVAYLPSMQQYITAMPPHPVPPHRATVGTIMLDGLGRSSSQGLPYEPVFPASSSSLVPFNRHLILLTNLQGI